MRIDAAIDHLAARVMSDAFGAFFTEADLAASHVADLRETLSPDEFEVHMGLAVAGSGPRETPNVSVLPRLDPWAERRGAVAMYSAEFKYFSYRGTTGGYRLTDTQFRRLLDDTEQQRQRLVQRVDAGVLAAGLVMWVDAFDWLARVKDEDARRAIVEERAAWFRDRFALPGSRVRAEYLPVRYPDLRVSLSNGFAAEAEEAAEVRRHSESLFGAAKPFIRRTPPPEEEWGELIAQAAVEDYLAGEGSG
jgi:hypothetical protein